MKNLSYPLISVIVPIYNSEKYLSGCIDSILKQSYKNFELLLIDDGSTDKSEDIIKNYLSCYENIRYFKLKHTGVFRARNFGVQHSSGEWISFIDSDDFISDHFFIDLIAPTKYDKEIDVSINSYYIYKENCSFPAIDKRHEGYLGVEDRFLFILKSEPSSPFLWNRIYRKSLFENVKLDENYSQYEDVIDNCRLFHEAR